MPEFDIEISNLNDDIAKIDVTGFLDAHTFEEMEKSISECFEAGYYNVVVNLEKVDYI